MGEHQGSPVGRRYGIRPTFIGEGIGELEWPADLNKKVVTADLSRGLAPANMAQYLWAGGVYDAVFENCEGQNPYSNWAPPEFAPGRRGLQNTFAVGPGLAAEPMKRTWYGPSFVSFSSDPELGAFAPPKLGRSTIGFRATITFPENLRLISTPSRLRKGRTATVRGSFALKGEWQAGKSVQIQRRKGSTWVKVRNSTVDANGRWTARFKANATAKYRVVGTGDPATGLDIEKTRTWTITTTK